MCGPVCMLYAFYTSHTAMPLAWVVNLEKKQEYPVVGKEGCKFSFDRSKLSGKAIFLVMMNSHRLPML